MPPCEFDAHASTTTCDESWFVILYFMVLLHNRVVSEACKLL